LFFRNGGCLVRAKATNSVNLTYGATSVMLNLPFVGSVGGFTVLQTAASNRELVSGLALLNASGQFDAPPEQKKAEVEETPVQRLFGPIKEFGKKWAIAFAFWQARQPARIKSVLQNVSYRACLSQSDQSFLMLTVYLLLI
jgi:pimeloyl-ACP methyl ester carboxylesterase